MLSFSGSLKVYVALEHCDMRKSFNGLHAAVREKLRSDPLSGALFLFSNRRRNLLKILYWDGSGLWVLAKRLERGTYKWPRSAGGSRDKIKLTPRALAMLTDGIDLKDGATRAWYEES
jgi:transposase